VPAVKGFLNAYMLQYVKKAALLQKKMNIAGFDLLR
jgi:hypothetical protein